MNPVYASVAYFRIPQFDSRAVSEQASLKESLEARLREALAWVPPQDCLVLDADEGAAVVLFGAPARALDLARAVHAKQPLHAGLNYGPLALSARGADARVIGDGLVGAAAAARFAQPEKLLVTQDYARALEATSPERAGDLEPAGEFTDTRVRLHSFFTPDPRRAVARRRKLLAAGASGVVVILLLGVVAREGYRRLFPPSPALLKLQVKPRGEIFVDGVSRGLTPPITQIQVAPGKHVVQIRAPGQPSVEIPLELQPGEQVTLTHTFGTGQKPSFWRELKRRFGGS